MVYQPTLFSDTDDNSPTPPAELHSVRETDSTSLSNLEISSVYFQAFWTVSPTLPVSCRIRPQYTVTSYLLASTVRREHSERTHTRQWDIYYHQASQMNSQLKRRT